LRSHGSIRGVGLARTWQEGIISCKGFSSLADCGNWKEFLLDGAVEKEIKEIRGHERTGRLLGRDGFVIGLEKALGRTLHGCF